MLNFDVMEINAHDDCQQRKGVWPFSATCLHTRSKPPSLEPWHGFGVAVESQRPLMQRRTEHIVGTMQSVPSGRQDYRSQWLVGFRSIKIGRYSTESWTEKNDLKKRVSTFSMRKASTCKKLNSDFNKCLPPFSLFGLSIENSYFEYDRS